MAVYRPKRKGTESRYYVCEFVYQGRRVQESTGATSRTVAKEYEKRRRAELERAHVGLPAVEKGSRIRSVSELTKQYRDDYKLAHRPLSIKYVDSKLAHIDRLLGAVLLADLTEDVIRGYIRKRLAEGVCGRSINMELGELSRAIGFQWRVLWPKVKKLEERKDVGQALSPERQTRLTEEALKLRSPVIRTIVPLLLLTGVRPGEAMSMQWPQINLSERTITVGRAKTSSGTGRVIPINDESLAILQGHRLWFIETFGALKPGHYVFPFGAPQPTDPFRPITDFSSAWDRAREAAGVKCRPHDLRHTFCTRLAEDGVPESTMLSLMGHMSRAMLERYSHIRMAAKRKAVTGLTLKPTVKDSEPNSRPVPVKVPVPKRKKGIR